jgi:hypothetical protein
MSFLAQFAYFFIPLLAIFTFVMLPVQMWAIKRKLENFAVTATDEQLKNRRIIAHTFYWHGVTVSAYTSTAMVLLGVCLSFGLSF